MTDTMHWLALLILMAPSGWWAWRYASPAKRKRRKTQRDAREARIVDRITGNTPMNRILGN